LHVKGGTNENVMIVDATGTAANYIFDVRDDGTSKFRVDSSGNVGIGTTSPSAKLHLKANASGGTAQSRSALVIEDDDGNADSIQFLCNDAGFQSIYFGDASDNDVGRIAYSHSGNSMRFNTNASEAMRIDSSGNVLVSKTAAGTGTVGVEARSDGLLAATRDGNQPLLLNRKTSDGNIALFQKDGSTVGSIGTNGDRIYLVGANEGIAIDDSLNELFPCNTGGNVLDNTLTLGGSNRRFKDLYLSGGAYLGGTAAANQLDDYEEGDWTPALTATGGGATIGYNSQVGKYIKVGRLVTVWCRITLSSVSGGSGDAKVSGLPFSVENTEAMRGNSHVMLDQLSNDRRTASIQADPNGTTLSLIRDSGSTGSHAAVLFSDMTASTDVRFQYSYRTA